MYDTRRGAIRTARLYPKIGSFIAEIHVPTDGRIAWERTTNTYGHYTLWGDPDELLATVIDVSATTEGHSSAKGTRP